MKKFSLAAISLVLIGTLVGCSLSPFGKEEFPEKHVDLAALGDSLTVGVGDEKELNGYVGRLATSMPEKMVGVKDVKLHETAKKGRRSDELIEQINSGKIDQEIKDAEIITFTIGGNDLMKVFRNNLTNLQKDSFDAERPKFKERYSEIFKLIRERNKTAPIIAIGVYNPLTVYTTEASQFDDILTEWNGDMEEVVKQDEHAVFVPVVDLFHSNKEKVYSDDFFHPNAKGYTNMKDRIIETLNKTDVKKLSNNELDMRKGD